jgi:hypothetical protein
MIKTKGLVGILAKADMFPLEKEIRLTRVFFLLFAKSQRNR